MSHTDWLKRAQLRGAHEFLEAKAIPYWKTDLFQHFDVSRSTGYRILGSEESSRQRQHGPGLADDNKGKMKSTFEYFDKLTHAHSEETTHG
jgi:hypothetical protein